jgi:transposase
MSKIKERLSLSKKQEAELRLMTRRKASKRASQRAQIILDYASGMNKSEISRKHQLHRSQVIEWIARFLKQGIGGLEELPGRGRPEEYTAA